MSNPLYQEIGYCELQADFANVPLAAAKLKAYCQLRALDEELWPSVELIFCEALNNAIEHGCQENPTLKVLASWKWEDEFIEFTFDDPGIFESPKKAGHALPEDILSESGRGFFIIESLVDHLAHEQLPSGHRLLVRKELHRPRNPAAHVNAQEKMIGTMSASLQKSYLKNSVLQGLAEDLAENPLLEGIVSKGVERLKRIATIEEAQIWIQRDDQLVQLILPEMPQRYQPLNQNSSTSIAKAFATTTARFTADCDALEMDDPLKSENRCALSCPILFQGAPVGVIALSSPLEEAATLSGPLKDLAIAFAQFLGIAHTSALTFQAQEEYDRNQTQLEVASEIQQSLLPSQYPSNQYCKTIGKCKTALAVGGDFIDAIEIRDSGLLIVIADVMGKGVPAALLATIFRTAVRARLNLAETPGWMLSQINRQIHKELSDLDMFITAQAAFLTYDKKKLKLASAGHCPALLLSQDQSSVTSLTAEGMPLGIDAKDIYEERIINMDTGDRVLFITDGLYEAENPQGQMLGLDGLSAQIGALWESGIESLPEKAFKLVDDFSRGETAQDDKTLLALEIN